MNRFGRRRKTEAATHTEAQASVEADPVIRAQGTYRIAVSHADTSHAEAAPAHWGPAYNAAFGETLAHLKGVSVSSVDLLEEAQKAADRCREAHGDEYEVWVERLITRDGESEWEKVA
jgi:hypothetical protein